MADGYNKPGSSVFHSQQRCSGSWFPAMAAISSQAAENRGLRACSNCCGGVFPHNQDGDADE